MATTGQTRRHPRVKAPAGMLVGWQVGTQRYVSRLENIALGGLFIRTPNPPPADSLVKVIVSLPLGTGEVQARGVVRRVAPSRGMGVEFTQATPEHRAAVEKFLGVLTENRTLLPELLVEPEGLETDSRAVKTLPPDVDDPLLQLFYGEPLTAEDFQEALRKQRGAPAVDSPIAAAAHA